MDATVSRRRLRVLPRERRANDGRNETHVEDAGEQRYEADHHQDDSGPLDPKRRTPQAEMIPGFPFRVPRLKEQR